MTSHKILITKEYKNDDLFSVYMLQALKALFYANFINSVWIVQFILCHPVDSY